jgi:hypothetical protein
VLAEWRIPRALVKVGLPEANQDLWLADAVLNCKIIVASSQVPKVAVDMSLHVAL